MKMLTLKVLVGVGLVASLAACAANKEEPKLNPNPQHFLTLKGYMAPELKGKIYLSFVQTYVATASQCVKTINSLAGAEGAPTKTEILVPKIGHSGRYELKIPIDKYTTGDCKWVALSTGFNILPTSRLEPDNNTLIYYTNDQSPKNNLTALNIVCLDTVASCHLEIPKGYFLSTTFNLKESENFSLNIFHEGHS